MWQQKIFPILILLPCRINITKTMVAKTRARRRRKVKTPSPSSSSSSSTAEGKTQSPVVRKKVQRRAVKKRKVTCRKMSGKGGCREKIADMRQKILEARLSTRPVKNNPALENKMRRVNALIVERSGKEQQLKTVEEKIKKIDKQISKLAVKVGKKFPQRGSLRTTSVKQRAGSRSSKTISSGALPAVPGEGKTMSSECKSVKSCNAQLDMLAVQLRLAEFKTQKEAMDIRKSADFKKLKKKYKERIESERVMSALQAEIKELDAKVLKGMRL